MRLEGVKGCEPPAGEMGSAPTEKAKLASWSVRDGNTASKSRNAKGGDIQAFPCVVLGIPNSAVVRQHTAVMFQLRDCGTAVGARVSPTLVDCEMWLCLLRGSLRVRMGLVRWGSRLLLLMADSVFSSMAE